MTDASSSSTRTLDCAPVIRTVAQAASLDDAFAAVAAEAQATIGHRLLTVMFHDAVAMAVQRVYSSDPDAYPAGGRKAKRDTWWGRHVLEEGKPYIGRTAEDIRAHFTDHELIAGLGLASILNLPVRVCGQTVGTVNLLHVAGHYHDSHVEPGLVLAGLAAAPLLLARDTRA